MEWLKKQAHRYSLPLAAAALSGLLLGAALAVEWASRLPREGLIAEEDEAGADGAITI